MTVTTDAPAAGLDRVEGVYEVRQEGSTASFQVDNSMIGCVLKHLNGYGIRYMTSVPPTLEELFMRHYGDDIDESA